MFKRLILILACILTVWMLSSPCASEDKSTLPLAVGNKWEYSVVQVGVLSTGEGKNSRSAKLQTKGTCIEEVVSIKERRENGDTVYEHRSVTKTEAGLNSRARKSTMDALMLVSKEGIFITASKLSGLDNLLSDEWVKYDPPLTMYKAGMQPGTTWKVGTVREDNLRMPMEARVACRETVTVPAGTFKDCLKLYVTCSNTTGTMGFGEDQVTIKSGKSMSTVWVYPGIGVVKEDNILQAKMLFGPDESGHSALMTGTQRKIKELKPGYVVQ